MQYNINKYIEIKLLLSKVVIVQNNSNLKRKEKLRRRKDTVL